MKKVLCNKTGILLILNLILISIYAFLVPITFIFFKNILGNKLTTYIFIPIYVVLYIILHICFYKKSIKKHGIYMHMENNTIVYNHKVLIPKIMITKIVYKAINIDERKLVFHLCDDSVEEIYISKRVARKIAKTFQLNIIYDKESRKKYKEEKKKHNKSEITNFCKEYKYCIIFSLIGLVLTIFSFIFDNKVDNNIIKIIICILCIVCGWSQLFFLYIKKIDEDILVRIILSIIATVVILVLMVILLMLIMNDLNAEIKVDCIFYAIYLFPSFIMIGLLTLLVLSGM